MKPSTVLRTKALVSAIAVGLGGCAAAAEAETLQDRKALIEAPQNRGLELEQSQQTAGQSRSLQLRTTSSPAETPREVSPF
jgi:hypothetical protein